jgi:hypothetical protein
VGFFWSYQQIVRFIIAHDFFTAQPSNTVDVFYLRTILHDWPDAQALQILKQLRLAAAPSTKLLIAENILPVSYPEQIRKDPVSRQNTIGGKATIIPYFMDVHVGFQSASNLTPDANSLTDECHV